MGEVRRTVSVELVPPALGAPKGFQREELRTGPQQVGGAGLRPKVPRVALPRLGRPRPYPIEQELEVLPRGGEGRRRTERTVVVVHGPEVLSREKVKSLKAGCEGSRSRGTGRLPGDSTTLDP